VIVPVFITGRVCKLVISCMSNQAAVQLLAQLGKTGNDLAGVELSGMRAAQPAWCAALARLGPGDGIGATGTIVLQHTCRFCEVTLWAGMDRNWIAEVC
jgi:hypothetical protein